MDKQLIKKYGKTKLIQILKELQPHLNRKQQELNRRYLRKMQFGTQTGTGGRDRSRSRERSPAHDALASTLGAALESQGDQSRFTQEYIASLTQQLRSRNVIVAVDPMQAYISQLNVDAIKRSPIMPNLRLILEGAQKRKVFCGAQLIGETLTAVLEDPASGALRCPGSSFEMVTGRAVELNKPKPDEWEHLLPFYVSYFLEGEERTLPGLYIDRKYNGSKGKSDFLFDPAPDGGNYVPIRVGLKSTTGWLSAGHMWSIINSAVEGGMREGWDEILCKTISEHQQFWRTAANTLHDLIDTIHQHTANHIPALEGKYKKRDQTNETAKALKEDKNKPPTPKKIYEFQVPALMINPVLQLIIQYMGCITAIVSNSHLAKLMHTEGRDSVEDFFTEKLKKLIILNDLSLKLKEDDETVMETLKINWAAAQSVKNAAHDAEEDAEEDVEEDAEDTAQPAAIGEPDSAGASSPPPAPLPAQAAPFTTPPGGISADSDEDDEDDPHVKANKEEAAAKLINTLGKYADGIIEREPSGVLAQEFVTSLDNYSRLEEIFARHRVERLQRLVNKARTLGNPRLAGRSDGVDATWSMPYFGKKQKRWVADLKGKKKFVRRQVYSMRKDLVTPSYFEKMTGADFWKLPVVK